MDSYLDAGFVFADAGLRVDVDQLEAARCDHRLTRSSVCKKAGYVGSGATMWRHVIKGHVRKTGPVARLCDVLRLDLEDVLIPIEDEP